MRIEIITVTALEQNCTLLICEQSARAVVIDPGGDVERIAAAIARHNVQVTAILLTHGHLDHVGGAPELAQHVHAPIWGPHAADEFLFQALPNKARLYGLAPVPAFTPDRWLNDGDTITFGQHTLEVLHCPGHTPGHVVYFHRPEALAQVGDVIFHECIGRSDLPGGDTDQLLDSIHTRLFTLGDDVRFIPGHGPLSTFGHERCHNPFLTDTCAPPA